MRIDLRTPRSPARSGFILPWIIITVAIIAVLAAATAPTLTTLDDRARALSAATQLKAISDGFIAFETAVNRYPGNISELSIPITTSSKTTCRTSMNGGQVTNWD